MWSAGFSFGSWIALEQGASDDRVRVLIGIAPPVEGRGYEFPSTLASAKPKFFIQGERDDICPLKALRRFYGQLLEPKEMVVIDGADHLFDGKTREVGDAIEDLLGDYDGREGSQ
jgi:alpha/beta superfamily hydrolase